MSLDSKERDGKSGASEPTVDEMTPEASADLNFEDYQIFTLTRPRDIVGGTFSGVKNLLIGLTVGGIACLYLPVESAYSGYWSAAAASTSSVSGTLLHFILIEINALCTL